MLVSIVIPVYNTAKTLPEISRRVDAVFRTRADDDYELIFVDDCSPNPATWPALEATADGNPRVKIVQLTRNFGQQGATLCGNAEAGGDVVMTMDDDLQHRPEDIPALLAEAGHDIVIGQFRRKRHNLFKRATSWLKGWFDYTLIGKPKHLQSTSFRLYSRTVAEGLKLFHTPNPFMPALLFQISKDIVGVDVDHAPREDGRSGYSLGRMVKLFSNLIINNSSFLLRMFAYLGMGLAALSLAMFFVVLYQKLVLGVPIQGWASLMATLLLVGGTMMLIMGIMGEYLLRAIQSTEGNPAFFVRRRRGGIAAPRSGPTHTPDTREDA